MSDARCKLPDGGELPRLLQLVLQRSIALVAEPVVAVDRTRSRIAGYAQILPPLRPELSQQRTPE